MAGNNNSSIIINYGSFFLRKFSFVRISGIGGGAEWNEETSDAALLEEGNSILFFK